MNALEQGVFTASCLRHVVPAVFRPRLWAAWWPLALGQAAWLAALVGFAHPLVASFMLPLLASLAGPEIVHYPNVFRVLSGLQARGAFVLFALAGPVVLGAATRVFDDWFSGRRPAAGAALGAALRRAPALIAAQAPMHLLLLLFSFGLAGWLEARQSSGLVARAVMLAGVLAGAGLQAVFLYVVPAVMLGGLGPVAAWREIPHAFGRAGMVAVLLVVLAALLGAPAQFAAGLADAVVDRGRPELMVAVAAAELVLGLVLAFVLTAGAVLAYRSLIEPAEDVA